MPKEFYLLRHCETSFSSEKKIVGASDISILDKNKDNSFYIDINVFHKSRIISSPLLRCIETLDFIKKRTELNFEYVTDVRLIERNMGSLEGLKREDAIKLYPYMFEDGIFNFKLTPPNGEEFCHFFSRIVSFYNELCCDLTPHIICSHNQVLRVLTSLILNVSLDEVWYRKNFKCGILTTLND